MYILCIYNHSLPTYETVLSHQTNRETDMENKSTHIFSQDLQHHEDTEGRVNWKQANRAPFLYQHIL